MPKSRHRKNHKRKVEHFKQKQREQHNNLMKFQKMLQEEKEISRRESLIETIWNNKPEIAKEDENGNYVMNDEVLEMNDQGYLVWKESGNPLLAGIEPLENYGLYTKEHINELLARIVDKKQNQEGEAELVGENQENSDDFDLAEDPNFSDDKSTE